MLFSELALKDRIADVLKAELPVEQLLADFATVQRDYTMRAYALRWLESKGVISGDAFSNEPREWAATAQAPWESRNVIARDRSRRTVAGVNRMARALRTGARVVSPRGTASPREAPASRRVRRKT